MRHFPNRDRLSVLTAVIVLAYALTRFLDLPLATGPLAVDAPLVIQLLVAALISTGADALIRSHPRFARRTTFIHWVVPGATALVLGAALEQLADGPPWWLGLMGSALALSVVLVAEYVAVADDDPQHTPATLVLGGLAYALAFIVFALLRARQAEAWTAAAVSGGVAAGLAGRLFVLNGARAGRAALYAAAVGLVSAQAGWVLSYWRASATGAALVALLVFYLAVGLLQQALRGPLTRRVWLEYGVIGLLGLGVVLGFGL